MSAKINQTLETVTNISIIIVAILSGYILVQNFILSPSNNLASNNTVQENVAPFVPPVGVQIGAKVNVPEVDWRKNNRTLIIYSRKGCRFCTESMPFYKELAQKQAEFETKIIVVSYDPVETSKEYFEQHDVKLTDVIHADLGSVGVRGTPTLLLVNENGEVSNSWVGRLPKEKEREVISQL